MVRIIESLRLLRDSDNPFRPSKDRWVSFVDMFEANKGTSQNALHDN